MYIRKQDKNDAQEKTSNFGRLFIRFFLSIFVTVMLTALGLQHGFNTLLQIIKKDAITLYYQDLVRGAYHVMEQDFLSRPEDSWQAYLESLQPFFGYPIALQTPDSLDLTPQERERLLAGEILVQEEGERYHMRIRGSKTILTMGRFPDPDFGIPLNILVWLAFALGFGIMTLVWTFPYALKLKKINHAVLAFGAGDLSSRVSIPKTSSLAPMAMAFNAMADKIGHLIASHRDLIHAVSHELRTPAARIRFGLEMLRAAASDTDKQRYMDGMHEDVDEMERLLSELLTYTRFSSTTPALQMQEGEPGPWLAKIVKDFKAMHPTLSIHLTQEMEGRACFEPFYLARAVGNLLENAARYGRSTVAVHLAFGEALCCIHIDDDGEGIPPEDREKIFEPFVRLDPSRSKKTGGHGLGLAIVRNIIESHGGTVRLSASSMGGARFTLCWPASLAQIQERGDGG
ncbi:ATP-binding protein [Desulfobotulus sp.]|uniref:ATP-binding protein n=1 Tax=Desulfobotulus sp. TaxID=1940337 RepID=UPI002A361250|nr:ATP-binding protein [Desulfobotulus sp.]MDY0163869.1 ATP-binding protein [Desulfobotulus sp.]